MGSSGGGGGRGGRGGGDEVNAARQALDLHTKSIGSLEQARLLPDAAKEAFISKHNELLRNVNTALGKQSDIRNSKVKEAQTKFLKSYAKKNNIDLKTLTSNPLVEFSNKDIHSGFAKIKTKFK